jgi:hypothetical protein
MVKVSLICAALAAILIQVACSGAGQMACPEGTEQFAEYQLFFGRGDPMVVDEAAWNAFVQDTVQPRFPDGMTIIDAAGQWHDPTGAFISERTKLLILLALPNDDGMLRIDQISQEYEQRFGQASVLRVVGSSCVSFS